MHVYRCRICGDPYVGATKPSHCPFCGAPENYIIFAKDWGDSDARFTISEVSRANLEHALMLETNNALFYRCAFEISMGVELSEMFRALAKVEAEHASVIRKILDLVKPTEEEDTRGRCQAIDPANVNEAHDRETRAIGFYERAAEVAVEPRVKEVFAALVEVEKTHLELIGSVKNTFNSPVI
ncbi:MAG TPA: ferritin family protein [Candidatus Aquicultor sp.]|jgi:rubrerythrin